MGKSKKKIDNEKKELVISILKAKEIEYDEWLNSKYEELINKNINLLIEGLTFRNEVNK